MTEHKWLWRAWLGLTATVLLTICSVQSLALAAGYWIVCRFGKIPAWLIVSNMFESPSVLPWRDMLLLGASIVGSLTLGALLAIACIVVSNKLKCRRGAVVAFLFQIVFLSALAYDAPLVFDVLDGWFSIRHEIACRNRHSDYFAKNYHRVEPSSVTFSNACRNLIVIVSESLEEGFAEGALNGENLLPNLVRWRDGNYHADCQCQVAGASFTSAALTSFFYGIPRLRLDGLTLLQDTVHYPRYTVPSLWDVFLANGYECAYVQGGNFEFGSKGRLFPVCDGFRKVGFDDMCTDPEYLAEPTKHDYGVNDEVMFKYLQRETTRLAECGRPFVLFGLTMNPHCPEGWCSALKPHGNRGTLAESILAQDRMISEYLEWFSNLKCAERTVVVVLGDHVYWGEDFTGKTSRRVFNAVRVPGQKMSPFVRNGHRFATFDWAPTFIELAGGRLPADGRFGMGASLLRDARSLLEDMEESKFDDEMQSSLSDYWDMVLSR